MNQILTTEKIYVTPEIKRKKFIYKIEFFLSVFIICLLFSYYIYAEYDRGKSEEASQQILAQLKYQVDDTTIRQEDNDIIVVILDQEEEKKHQEEPPKPIANVETKVSKDGVSYSQEAILKIPAINIEYVVLSDTSPELLFVSLNKFFGPNPNEVGNYCIAGHYYESGKMFGKLHKLKNGDIAELTDLYGRTVKYEVYDKKVVEPYDTSCTSQRTTLDTNTRELTLITCTNHGKQRLVVKLREVR
ncbi:MAG: sortase [Clostridia bacterium]|nr:sortase [Clostridia bacterium]